MDELRSLLSTNQSDRLKKEKAAQDRSNDSKLPRHTVYQGDRKIQQLGQNVIDNGVIINNQSLSIGQVMLPLAKGNVLRRVDNTNGGALLGTAYRDAVENDFDANGNRRETELGRNGGNEPSNPSNPNNPRKPSDRVPPPFGCVPPPSQCFWSSNPIAPDGFQSHGDAVVNENAQPVYLYCVPGTSVPANLGCDFLSKWACSGGVCSQSPSGIYNSQAECEAARTGGYDVFTIRVESRTDNLVTVISDLTYTNVHAPIGSTFSIDSIPSSGGAPGVNTNGMADGVKVSPSGLYFDGVGFVSGFLIWTFGTISILTATKTDTVPFDCP